MTGTLAQLLSLVSFGNEYIVQGKVENDYYPQNSVFKFDKQVSFKTVKSGFFRKNKEIIAGNDPLEWFQFLKKDNCRELKAFYQHSKQQEKYKDYKLAGFVDGGGQWFIEAIYKDYSDFWYAHWNVGNKEDPEQKIWLVIYEAVARRQPIRNIQLLLNDPWKKLETKLKEIELFARQNNLDSWADCFAKALKTLNSETPYEDFYHTDMIVLENYSLQAKQLIFGAANAWVFGGMGSWNDIGFNEKEKEEKYELHTEELYDAVITALLAGINTY
jgi:hypothetical protein